MIRTLFAIPLIALFYGLAFAAYIATSAKLIATGRMFQFDFVNSAFSEVCNLFRLDLNDWVSGKKFGDRLDKLMDDTE